MNSSIIWKPKLPPQRKYKKGFFDELGETGEFVYQIGEWEGLRKKTKEVSLKDIKSGIFREKLGYIDNLQLKVQS